MRKLALLFNPDSRGGRNGKYRLEDIVARLRSPETTVLSWTAERPHDSAGCVREALAEQCDALLLCGGDGTFNQALQELLAALPSVPVGIIPLGSGNLLAKQLGIPADPLVAAGALRSAAPMWMSLGLMQTGEGRERYWAVAAGVGADARVICSIPPERKALYGQKAYYAEAARQLLSTAMEFPRFIVEWTELPGGRQRSEAVTQVVAERVDYFSAGHCTQPPLAEDELRVVLFKTTHRSAYIAYGTALMLSRTGLRAPLPRSLEVVRTRSLTCRMPAGGPLDGRAHAPILAEVDGELVGGLPVRISVRPRALRVLSPARKPLPR